MEERRKDKGIEINVRGRQGERAREKSITKRRYGGRARGGGGGVRREGTGDINEGMANGEIKPVINNRDRQRRTD